MRYRAPALRLADEKGQASGEVSDQGQGFISWLRWLDMTPKTECQDRYAGMGLPF